MSVPSQKPQGHGEADIKRAVAQAESLCQEGNSLFGRGEICSAARCYEEGLGLVASLMELRSSVLQLQSGAVIWAVMSKRARVMQLTMLSRLACCLLRGQPPERPPDPAEALKVCDSALGLDPRSPAAALCRGQALARLGRAAEAEAALARAAELDPKSAVIAKELELVRRQGEKGVPAPERAPDSAKSVPLNLSGDRGFSLNFPSPLVTVGITAIDGIAAQIASRLEERGTAAYARELVAACRGVVELRFGPGAGARLARVDRCAQMIGRQECVEEHEPGKGRRYMNSYMEGLLPVQPFHDVEAHPWLADLATHRGTILAELKQQAGSALWKALGDSGDLAAEWRSIPIIEQGLWVCKSGFEKTRAVFTSLRGVRPFEAFLSCMPPHSEIRPHSDETNFLLNAHLALELEEGLSVLTVGDCSRAWRAGETLVFDHSFVHSAANDSGRDRYVLVCRFWHPGCTDEEAYALCFVTALLGCIVRQGRVEALFVEEARRERR